METQLKVSFFLSLVALLVATPCLAEESDFDALCKHSFGFADLGKKLKNSGITNEMCLEEVERKIGQMEKDSSVLAPIADRQFDKKVYLYMVIGGAAFAQCLEPKSVTYEEYKASTCKNISAALPIKR
jgi:hypothetical protein